jgi:hypothetical protein
MTKKTETTEHAPEANVFSSLGEALGSAAEKFEEGSAVSRQSVGEAAKVTRSLFVKSIYKSAYWTSYGLVFSGVYLIELLPEKSSFRRGLEEGATNAQTKVHEGKAKKSTTPTRSVQPGKTPRDRKRRAAKYADVV